MIPNASKIRIIRFLTLGVEEYSAFVKKAACEKREQKFALLRKIFRGLANVNYEKQWEFHYYFKLESEKRGHIVIDESQDYNIPWIIVNGDCGVYKSGKNASSNFKQWLDSASKELKSHKDFSDFSQRMGVVCKRIPENACLYIGELSSDESVGMEALLNEYGRGLFTIKVNSPTIKHYKVVKQVRRIVWNERRQLVDRMVTHLMTVFMYRLRSLENTLEILGTKKKLMNDKDIEMEKMFLSNQMKKNFQEEVNNRICGVGDNNIFETTPKSIPQRSKFTNITPIINQEILFLKETFKIGKSVQHEMEEMKSESLSEAIKMRLNHSKSTRFASTKNIMTQQTLPNISMRDHYESDSILDSSKILADSSRKIKLNIKEHNPFYRTNTLEQLFPLKTGEKKVVRSIQKTLNSISPRSHRKLCLTFRTNTSHE